MALKQSSVPLSDYLFNKASRSKVPISGTFELTPVCNFACRMCYVRKTPVDVKAASRRMLTQEQWLQIAREAYNGGMLHLLLTGGEPMLFPDFWILYEKLARMGFLISINTNGSLLDDEAISRLKALPPRRVNITLYGIHDKTYQNLCGVTGIFAKVDRSIRALQEAGVSVKLNCSLTPYNVCDLEDMIVYAKERELILDAATYMFPPVRRDPSMTGRNERFTAQESAYYRMKVFRMQQGEGRYLEFLRSILHGSVLPPGLDENCIDPMDGQIRCRAGKACFWVTWDGWMTPCGMMTEPRIDAVGRSFIESWEELTEVSDKIALSGICGKCPNMDLCHSCAAMAQTETGDVSGIPVYLCETVREMKKIAKKEMDRLT